MDYSSYVLAASFQSDALTIDNSTIGASSVIAKMKINSYPLSSNGLVHQKFMFRITDGYFTTTSLPFIIDGYVPLWYNQPIGLYIYSQQSIPITNSHTFVL